MDTSFDRSALYASFLGTKTHMNKYLRHVGMLVNMVLIFLVCFSHRRAMR